MNFEKLKKYILITFFIFLLLFSIGFVFLLIQNKNAEIYYKQGLEYYSKNDYQNAYYNFSKILPISDLFINSLYKQAKCADLLNDSKTSIKKYAVLEFYIKNEDITPYILWRKGNIFYNLNNLKKAKSEFQKLQKRYPETEYGIAADYMLYKIDNNYKFLIHYLENSPNGKFSKKTIELIKNKKYELNSNEKIILAKAMYENEDYNNAVEILKTVPLNLSFEYLIKSFDKLNSSENVINIFKKGVEVQNFDYNEDIFDEIISIYIKHSGSPKLILTDEIYKLAKNENLKMAAFNKNIIYSSGENAYFKRIKFYKKHPNSKFAKDAIYNLFIENLTNGKNQHALKYGKIYLSLYKDKQLTPSVLYFVAILKKNTMDNSYKENIQKLFIEYPNSYYTYLAYSRLPSLNFKNKRTLQITSKTNIEYPYQNNKKAANFYNNFIKYNDFSFLDDFRIKNPVIQSWLEYKRGNRATSSVIAREYIKNSKILPKRENPVWKLAYPIYYRDEINYYSKQKNLNPYLMLSLIKEESHFNPNIVSYVGATGLMQVMPTTAEMMAKKTFSSFELMDEKLNIEIGTDYFSYLMNEFLDNEAYCILSYNSGPNAVKSWLNQSSNIPFEVMVEKIPYRETKNYIKKVYAAYWNYLLTYEDIKFPI